MKTRLLLLGALAIFAAAVIAGCDKEDPQGGQTQKIYREAQGTTGDLTWKLTSDGTLTISGEGAMPDYEDERIDEEIIVYSPWFGLEFISVVIESGVTTIGESAFLYCDALTRVTIPNSVATIGRYAFCACDGLTSVTIPNSVTTIENEAFSACDGLKSIEVAVGNPNYSSQGGVLFDKGKTTLIQYPGGKSGAYTIPNSVTTIYFVAFSACRGLTSVTIPNSVKTIKFGAFDMCSNLKSVTIGSGVTTIEEYAFYGCISLTDVIIRATTPPILYHSNFEQNSEDTLHVPAGCVAEYKMPGGWRTAFTNIVEQQ
jgi:hypothetical protein